MSRSKWQTAFALIADFKQGKMTPGAAISDGQIELLKLLCEDLLPGEQFSVDRLEQLIEKVARADSEWNHKTQVVIDEFYVLKEVGKDEEARRCRRSFLEACPSAWFRGIVENL